MAHKKSGTSTRLGRDSIAKRLGVKIYPGQIAKAGSVIIRQRGTPFRAGKNVRRGKDDTLYAVKEGKVKFVWRKVPRFTGKLKWTKYVEVE